MFTRMIDVEKRGAGKFGIPTDKALDWAKGRVVILFVIVIIGIMASWAWEVLWTYVKDPSKPLAVSLTMVLVRFIIALIAGAVTFRQMYLMIDQASTANGVQYMVAFENGFLYDATLKTVTASVTPAAVG